MKSPYKPEDGDILVHRWNPDDYGDAFFSLRTSHGVGKPHYFVCLDENGGERSWWLDPDQAEIIGKRLLDLGAECRELNAREEQRRAEWREQHRDSQ